MRLTKCAALACLIVAVPVIAFAQSQWVLKSSTIIYHVTHPLHHANGVSTAARGMGVCKNNVCNFLAAAPVKSFHSGDSNRDLHMLEITRGAKFPMVVVRTQLPESDLKTGTYKINLSVQFSGHTADFKQIPFHIFASGNQLHIVGTIPATCSDFKIPRPELLAMPIDNAIPVSVDMTWQEKKTK